MAGKVTAITFAPGAAFRLAAPIAVIVLTVVVFNC
jgi:hypothetical protein